MKTSATVHFNVDHKTQLGSIVNRVRSNAARAAYNYAQRVEGGAKRRVHVQTGFLKNSIRRTRIDVGKHRVVVGAHYGIYEEYGTRHRPPHPYFRPAIEEAKAQFRRDIARVFR